MSEYSISLIRQETLLCCHAVIPYTLTVSRRWNAISSKNILLFLLIRSFRYKIALIFLYIYKIFLACRYSCPVCSKSYCDMTHVWERLDQEVSYRLYLQLNIDINMVLHINHYFCLSK